MTDGIVIAISLFTAAILITGGAFVLAKGAHAWADAIGATHEARFRSVQANAAVAADDALSGLEEETEERERLRSRADFTPPTDAEIRAQLLAERVLGRSDDEGEITTSGNEGYDEEEPIPAGGMYRGSGGG